MSHRNTHSRVHPKQIKLRTSKRRKLCPQSSCKSALFQTLCKFYGLTSIWQIQRPPLNKNRASAYFANHEFAVLMVQSTLLP